MESEDFLVSTGRIIKEYLDENNINQKELSRRIGMSEKHISHVLNGNSRLTEEFALKLEKILTGVPAAYWLNYEAKYREHLARNEEKVRLQENDLLQIARQFHFKEVFSGLDLSIVEQAIEMLKLLKIGDFANFNTAYSNLSVEFMEDGGEKEAIAIWLNLCEAEIEIQNAELSGIVYDRATFLNELGKFKRLANNENIDLSIGSCRKLCNRLGIYLVICEAITNSKVRGALTTYEDHPAVYLSGRFQTHDHIWFAFMHEIGHLLKHYNKKDVLVSYEDTENMTDDKEREANEFARDFFINHDEYDNFVACGQFSEKDILRFARAEKVVPGMVVARLQHDNRISYRQYAYLK